MAESLRSGGDRSSDRQARRLVRYDPRRQLAGTTIRDAEEIAAYQFRATGKADAAFNPLPAPPRRTSRPKSGQFAAAKALFADVGSLEQIMFDPNASAEAKATAERKYDRIVSELSRLGFTENDSALRYYDPKDIEYFLNQYSGGGELRDTAAAYITDYPTSTTNPRRPRTVGAGYDKDTQTVTVIFRDGTAWNYYGVPEEAWIKFSQSITKGRFLNNAATNKGRGPGDLLTYSGHGPAVVSEMSESAQREFYKIARVAQVLSKDKATGVAQQNRRPNQQPNLIRRQNAAYLKKQAKLGLNPNANKGRR